MPEHRDDTPTTNAALQNVFMPLAPNQKTAAFVGVVDIGQGNLNAVFNPDGQPFLYFDLGRGAGANQCSFPDPEPGLCYAGLRMVVQSHLDEDHYMAGALASVQAGIGNGGAPTARFVLPQQAMGNFARAVKAGLLASNVHVHFWPLPNARIGNPPLLRVSLPGTSIEIIKCNGGNQNNSGLALRIRNPNPAPGNQDWILLTADVHLRTDFFPWNALPAPPPPPGPDLHMAGLVPSHHGARELQANIPRPPAGLIRSLAYSFGAGNNNGHPFNDAVHAQGDGVLSYFNQGWLDAGRLQTAGRPLDRPNFGPRGNLAILWPNAPAGPGSDSLAAVDATVAVALVATAAAAAQGAAAGAQSPRVPGAAAYQAALAYHQVRPNAPVAAYIRQRGILQAPIVAAVNGMGPPPPAAHLVAAINNNTAADAADTASLVEPLARAAVKLGAAAAEAAAQQLTQQAINARTPPVGGVASQTNAARQAVYNQQVAGTPSRLAGAAAAGAEHSAVPGLAFAAPSGIAIGVGGDPLVADAGYHRVVSLNYGNGTLGWIAGVVRTPGTADGVGPAARFQRPTALVRSGNDLYVADTDNHTIRRIDLTSNTVTTPAGQAGVAGSADGNGNAASFRAPAGLAISGTNLYVADTGNHTIRKIDLANGNAVTTIAGQAGAAGNADGNGNAARFNAPTGLAIVGTSLYVTDTGSHTIRKIDLANGNAVTTVAGQAGAPGSADGNGNAARFHAPTGLAATGTDLYVADTGNHTIRKIDLASGDAVTTPAGQAGQADNLDGNGNAARFRGPTGLTVTGTDLYVADTGNQTIRKIDIPNNNTVTTPAGQAGVAGIADGNGNAASFRAPAGLAISTTDLYVADTGNQTIRKIDRANGNAVTTPAGQAGLAGNLDGNDHAASFNAPTGLAITGTDLYVADTGSQTIRKIDIPNNKTVTTPAGQAGLAGNLDGNGNAARFRMPGGFAISGTNLYVADTGNHTIRKVDLANGNAVTTIAGQAGVAGNGNGNGNAARFNAPAGLTVTGTNLYVADTGNQTIRKIDLANGNAVTTVAGKAGVVGSANGNGNAARFNAPAGLTVTGTNLYVADTGNQTIRKIDLANGNAVTTIAGQAGQAGNLDGNGNAARFNAPTGLAIVGMALYVTDRVNHTIRKIDLGNGNAVTTVAGQAGVPGIADGHGNAASFNAPTGLTVTGAALYVADTGNQTIRKIDLGNGDAVTTVAGQVGVVGSADGHGNAARFNTPTGLAISGTNLYVTDTGNQTIRKIDLASDNAVTTIAGQAGPPGNLDGNGNAARFNAPTGLAISGTNLYVADTGNQTIRKIDLANGNAVTTVAGQAGVVGNADGNGNAARFNTPTGLAIVGTILYVTDTGNHTIRQIDLGNGNAVTTVAGQAGVVGSADGQGNAARFNAPTGLAIAGTHLYVADTGNQTIRQIDLASDHAVTTPAGQAGLAGNLDGNGNAASFNALNGLAITGTALYVADTGNQTIRKIDIAKANAVTVTAAVSGVVSVLVAENLLSFGRAAAGQPPPTVVDVNNLAGTLSDQAAWAYCVAAANSPGRPQNDPTAGGVLRPGMSPVAAADAAVTAIRAVALLHVEDGFQAALAVCGALGPAVEIQTTGVAVPGATPAANRAEYENRLMVAAVAAMVGVRHGVGTLQQNVRAAVAASRAAVAAARGGPIVGCHRHPSSCGAALCSLTLHEFIR